jgi:hypothetical protein
LESADFLKDEALAKVAVMVAIHEEVAALEHAPAVAATPEHAPAATLALAASPTVSLYTIASIRTENAILLSVFVHVHCLVVLLDFGSTHNFINTELMCHLHLATAPHPSMRVLVANGDCVPCEGVARDVALAISTEEFTISCFGINLGGFDLILGVKYLCTLGPILWDFEDLCMAFTRGGRRILWKGVGSPRDDIREPATRAVTTAPSQPLLDRLLLQLGPVFDEPCGLPPAQPYDHRIHLLLGTASIIV